MRNLILIASGVGLFFYVRLFFEVVKIKALLAEMYSELVQIRQKPVSIVAPPTPPAEVPVVEKKAGANRRPRTEEQKKAASERKKQEWAEKRRQRIASVPGSVIQLPALPRLSIDI